MTLQHFTIQQVTPLILSIFVLIASLTFYLLGKQKVSLFFLFIASLGFGYFIANLDPFLLLWDEQYHALVAKHMAKDPFNPMLYSVPLLEYDYKNWTNNHIWLHKQPLFLWQMAFSIKMFGWNTIAVRLPSIIMHAVATLLIFRIGKICSSENTGYYGALFFTVAYYPLELIAGRYSTDHNDIAFLFYITASFWAWFEYQHSHNRYYLILIGVFAGCAVLVKWLVGILIYPIWFCTIGATDKRNWLMIKNYSSFLISLSITLAIFVPWQLYILWKYPLESSYEFSYNAKHFFEPIEHHAGNIWFHFNALYDIYGSGDLIPFLYLTGVIVLLKNNSSRVYRMAIILAITFTYLFYSIASTKMTSYCIIVSPFAFLGIGNLVESTIKFLKTKMSSSVVEKITTATILLAICSFLLNISKIQTYHTDWKPKSNFNRNAEYTQMTFIKKLQHKLKDQNYVVFNASARLNGHIPVMFFTSYIAYDCIPTEKQITQIEQKGYKLAIMDNGSLPDYIKKNNSIVKVSTDKNF